MTKPNNFNDSSSDPWQEWFMSERGTELEEESEDECDYDVMDDEDYE